MNGTAKWVRVSLMAGALLPLLVGITSAANINSTTPGTNRPIQDDQHVATPSDQPTSSQHRLEKVKDLIGANIVNERGEQLGTIADVVLTPDRNGINYVVLAHGGTLGVAGKHFAVPWSKFSFGAEENGKALILKGVTKADLDRALGIDKDQWPAVASENWLGIERSPGAMPSAQAPAMPAPPSEGTASVPQPQAYVDRGMGMGENAGRGAAQVPDIQNLRVSKLLGMTVRNLQNENLGRLDNVMIDVQHGKLAYGIVAIRHGFLGLDKDFVAVPWSVLDWASQPGVARLDANRDTLLTLAFEEDNFPNLEDPQYSRQLYERFHATPYWESLGFIPGEEAKDKESILPGEKKEHKSGDLPSSEMARPDSGMVPPNSGMNAPNAAPPRSGMAAPNATAPNSAAVRLINDKDCDDHKDGHKHKDGYKGRDRDNQAGFYNFNPNAIQTFHGTISEVRASRVRGDSTEFMALTVRADNGRTVVVNVAPRFFLDRQNVVFNRGDPITVTGSLVRVGDRDILVASRIQTPNRIVDLRTPEGRPLWNLEQARAANPYDRDYGRRDYGQYRYRY